MLAKGKPKTDGDRGAAEICLGVTNNLSIINQGQIEPCDCSLVLIQDFAKGGGLNQKLKCSCLKKLAIGRRVEQTGVFYAYYGRGSEGRAPSH